ncbi:MAG: hypothetical protein IJO42_02720 [Clostridia bacterium]|nr:hypothetical protein [Clostridia bacterium]
MANQLQKLLFNLSTMSPLVLLFEVVYWGENDIKFFIKTNNETVLNPISIILLALILLSAVFSLYSIVFVQVCRKKLECIPIAIDNIIPYDNWIIGVLLSYAFPFASTAIEDLNLYITIGLVVVIVFFLTMINIVFPNPVLVLCGYHFYKIANIDGGCDIILLSKRKSVQHRNSVKKVIIAFNYLAIEEKEEDV